MKSWKDKVIIVTGASSGIGEALAYELVKRDAFVSLLARRKERLEVLAKDLNGQAIRALVCQADVTKEGELKEAVNQTLKQWGKIDVVIANAGFGVVGDLESLTVDDYKNQFETNIFGVLKTIYATLPALKNTKGCLVIVGSVSGHIPLPGVSAYAMSKAALKALCDSIGPELASYGVSVVLISPGFVETEIRKVDNQGNFHPQFSDPVPQWLRMPSSKAARKILEAISKRKAEAIITFHGKVFVFFHRYFYGLMRFIVNHFKVTGRKEAKP